MATNNQTFQGMVQDQNGAYWTYAVNGNDAGKDWVNALVPVPDNQNPIQIALNQASIALETVNRLAADLAAALLNKAGVVIYTGGNVGTVTFGTAFNTQAAPAVCATPLDGAAATCGYYGIAVLGAPGAWTGFTLTLQNNVFGAFNWVAQPLVS